jgi:hypothetical protein
MFRRTPPPPDPSFESSLRADLARLADRAPAAVRSPQEITVASSTRVEFDREPTGFADPWRSRRRVGILATTAAFASAIGIGAFAISGANDGGGATPAEAVAAFVDAMNAEDVLGVLDTVDPAEVDALRGAIEATTQQAQRIELLDERFSLSGVGGVDVSITDLLTTTNDITTDLAVVEATTGSISITIDLEAFGLGAVGREATSGAARSETASGSIAETMLATVRRDGRWYVSVGYTIVELVRRQQGVDVPSDEPIAAVGFATPESAASAFLTRLLDADLRGAASTAAPGEADALLGSWPLWLPDAQRSFDEFVDDGYDLAIGDLQFDLQGSGDRRLAVPVAYSVAGTWPRPQYEVWFDPTLDTVVYVDRYDESGAPIAPSGWVLVPAGTPLPITLEEIDPAAIRSYDEPWPTTSTNITFTNPDGTIAPIPAAPADAAVPITIGIDRRDGCTTFDAGASEVFGFGVAVPASEPSPTVSYATTTQCGPTLGGAEALLVANVTGGVLDLPAVAVVEIDGLWYVSPIGTLLGGIQRTLAAVDTSEPLIDSPIGPYLFGGDRANVEAFASMLLPGSVPAACEGVLVDGPTGIVTAPDPGIRAFRDCYDALIEMPPMFEEVAPVAVAETTATVVDD